MNELAKLEDVLVNGDLQSLKAEDRVMYYKKVCESVGLNPLTKPFEYIRLNGKLTLYARKDATDQLRTVHGISIKITSREKIEDVYIVTAQASNKEGRCDESTGAVNVKSLAGEALANAFMKAECVPLDYQILTKEGFKFYNELDEGEEVASYDMERGVIEWVPLNDISIYINQEVKEYHSNVTSFEFTEGHKWVSSKNYNNDDFELIEFEEIEDRSSILLSAPEKRTKCEISPKMAAAFGWLITDGTIRKYKGKFYRAAICQSKTENFNNIDESLSELGKITKSITSNRKKGWLDQHWWYLSKEQTKKLLDLFDYQCLDDLPRIAANLSFECREAMINSMMLADGDKRNTFGKGKIQVLECFQILCTLNGIALSQVKTRIFTKSTQPFYQLRKLSYTKICKGYLVEGETRNADVWCPTTIYGTWIMRGPTGQISITGNTKAKRRVTLSIAGLGLLDENEVETIPGALRVDMETGEVIESPAKEYKKYSPHSGLPPPTIVVVPSVHAKAMSDLFEAKDLLGAAELLDTMSLQEKTDMWPNLIRDEKDWVKNIIRNMPKKPEVLKA